VHLQSGTNQHSIPTLLTLRIMFSPIKKNNRGFMRPLGGRAQDRYYEDVYGTRNKDDEDVGCTADHCESESDSDSDGGVAPSVRKRKTIDAYGTIRKRKGELASSPMR